MSHAVSSFCGSRSSAFRQQAGCRRQQQVGAETRGMREMRLCGRGEVACPARRPFVSGMGVSMLLIA